MLRKRVNAFIGEFENAYPVPSHDPLLMNINSWSGKCIICKCLLEDGDHLSYKI